MNARPVILRAADACYVLMAAVTVIATAVGFWLSYAGLHSFAARAGLRGPEAWAWPSSVDLFILAGELGITISTLRDGRPDWRAWVYFAAGCVPSVAFNVLHVAVRAPGWGKYAVAATPPLAAVLALAALMQQVINLPATLRHISGSTVPAASGTVSAPDEIVPLDAESAAAMAYRATVHAGNALSQNQLIERFQLTRTQATKVRRVIDSEPNGHITIDS
jgi:hypothetical protein